ncbi:uncharacterized protein JCM15063_002815 [Sporobolomyces koalae]|uniref:uncharacterized protein n=1 Tax=Sporobolomyces koalae TaxID=500713 RepID=UPI00317D3399
MTTQLVPIREQDESQSSHSCGGGAPQSSSSRIDSHAPDLLPRATETEPRLDRSRRAFDEAKALYESGLWISKENPYAAIAHFLQAANVFDELDHQFGNKSKKKLKRSEEQHRKRMNKSLWQAGVCWGRVGWNAKKHRDWNGAKEAFEQALRIFVAIRDAEKEATTLYQLALVSTDVSEAADYLKKAALIYVETGESGKEAMCHAELGNLFGKCEKDGASALFHWRQALLVYLRTGDKDKEALSLFSIGEILGRTDREAAYNHFLQARVVFRTLSDRVKWDADCTYQLGKICVSHKSFEAAVQYFEEASALFRQIGLATDEAWALYRLALVMLKVHSKELAIDYLTEASLPSLSSASLFSPS